MRCPKCGYYSFDYLDSCPKCGMAWSEYKTQLNIKGLKPQRPNFLTDLLTTEETAKAEEFLLPGELEKVTKPAQKAEIKEKTFEEKEVLYHTEEIETTELAKEPEVNEEISEVETVGETLPPSEKLEKNAEPALELEAKEEITQAEEELPSSEEIEKKVDEAGEETKSVFEEIGKTLAEIEKMESISETPQVSHRDEKKLTSPELKPEPIEILEEIEKIPLDVSESDIEVLEDIESPKKK